MPLAGEQWQGRHSARLGRGAGPDAADPVRPHAGRHLRPLGGLWPALHGLPGLHHQGVEGRHGESTRLGSKAGWPES